MNRLKKIAQGFLDILGLRTLPTQVSAKINRQNYFMAIPVMIITFMATMIQMAIIGKVDFNNARMLMQVFIYMLLLVATIGFAVLTFFVIRKKHYVGWWHTLLLYIFIVIILMFGLQMSIAQIEKRQTFISLVMTFIWSLLLFNVRPVFSIPAAWTFMGLAVLWNARNGGMVDIAALNMLIFSITIVSFLRYHAIRRGFMSEMKLDETNKKLHYVSRHDTLTGVKNRTALDEDIEGFLNKDMIIFITDIDNFKHFNDTYGHEKGDEVIKKYTNAISKIVDKETIYRFGGDEFLIILPDNPDEYPILQQAYDAHMKDIFDEETNSHITGSAGMSRGNAKDAEAFHEMVRRADVNLYKAKEEGRNRMVVEHK